ncbi:MAG: hypothetical protein NVS3B24_18500 [Candidatus Dormibacteria bacterium]
MGWHLREHLTPALSAPDDRLRWRRAAAFAAITCGALIIAASALGVLPHLVLAQAVTTALLTMVVAPLSLLGRSRSPWGAPIGSVLLLPAGTITVQLPPVVTALSGNPVLEALALSLLTLAAVAFWSVVMPPGRLQGLVAAGYVLIGGLPISLPALFLSVSARDFYGGFHAKGSPGMDPLTDQLMSGFVMFGVVKVVIFVAFTALFIAESRREPTEIEEDHRRDGGRPALPDPALPGWALGLGEGGPTVPEPVPATVASRRYQAVRP